MKESKVATTEDSVGIKVEPASTDTVSSDRGSEKQTLEEQRKAEIRKLKAQIKILEQELNPPPSIAMCRS